MALFGFKLWENAFPTIPDISFFDSEIFFSGQHFDPKMYFLFEKKHLPLFGELRQTSQDLFDSDSDSNVSWDICFNSLKSGFLIFGFFPIRSEGLRV